MEAVNGVWLFEMEVLEIHASIIMKEVNIFMPKKKTAAYKIITDSGGNRYKFYCDLTGALLWTTKPYHADTPMKELELAWNTEGKAYFNLCHKCGKWVMEAMFNADALECVACAPWENTPEYCMLPQSPPLSAAFHTLRPESAASDCFLQIPVQRDFSAFPSNSD